MFNMQQGQGFSQSPGRMGFRQQSMFQPGGMNPGMGPSPDIMQRLLQMFHGGGMQRGPMNTAGMPMQQPMQQQMQQQSPIGPSIGMNQSPGFFNRERSVAGPGIQAPGKGSINGPGMKAAPREAPEAHMGTAEKNRLKLF